MNMSIYKTYTYVHEIAVDFDQIQFDYKLTKNSSIQEVRDAVHNYINDYDEIDRHFLIEDADDIAYDLLDYIVDKAADEEE